MAQWVSEAAAISAMALMCSEIWAPLVMGGAAFHIGSCLSKMSDEHGQLSILACCSLFASVTGCHKGVVRKGNKLRMPKATSMAALSMAGYKGKMKKKK
ncbi:hypothetical protein B0H63DRAFT_316094 [Podospora didyma]|uniref:Uncharacterized protein n=1 Tax=Podospora didyma TaxID=330526 RepID=A0AAE0K5D6_9PEZI|nr:hypothetical protein B0H63DRAFT_316094 [Podospora didyma]